MTDTGDLPRQQQRAAVEAWIDRALQISDEDWLAMLYFLKHSRAYIRALRGLLLQAAEDRAELLRLKEALPKGAAGLAQSSGAPYPRLPPEPTTYMLKGASLTPEQRGRLGELVREISSIIEIEEVENG